MADKAGEDICRSFHFRSAPEPPRVGLTLNLLTDYGSPITAHAHFKSFRCNTYKKRGEGYSSFPCHTENSPVSEHPFRMQVQATSSVGKSRPGRDHRELMGHSDLVGRDLTRTLNPLAATLAENHLLSPAIATDPKTHLSKPCICHTSETPWGAPTRSGTVCRIHYLFQGSASDVLLEPKGRSAKLSAGHSSVVSEYVYYVGGCDG